jgi:hypothetical protein
MEELDPDRLLDRDQTLMESLHMRSRRWSTGLASLLAAAALAWWLLRPSSVPPELPGPAAATPMTAAAPAPAEPPVTNANFTEDGVPIRPAGSVDGDAEGMRPHPITPQHKRIFRENDLIGALNAAMDQKDVAELRSQLKQYRDEYPEDAHVLADGYQIIADCLEYPGPQTRAVAQRYYDEELDSGLRRYIRRHCLEEATP